MDSVTQSVSLRRVVQENERHVERNESAAVYDTDLSCFGLHSEFEAVHTGLPLHLKKLSVYL